MNFILKTILFVYNNSLVKTSHLASDKQEIYQISIASMVSVKSENALRRVKIVKQGPDLIDLRRLLEG